MLLVIARSHTFGRDLRIILLYGALQRAFFECTQLASLTFEAGGVELDIDCVRSLTGPPL